MSTSASYLGLSIHMLRTYANCATCQKAVFELDMHYLIKFYKTFVKSVILLSPSTSKHRAVTVTKPLSGRIRI